MSVSWNPWHGCQRVSEGCRECYVYRQDAAWQKDGGHVVKTTAFSLPVRRSRDGRWKIPAGEMVFTCFTSDFLLAEADVWRREAWEMIRLRRDLHFMFFTKRIDRLSECLPGDWGAGYEHVTIGCTVENQRMADYRLPIFQKLPIRHKIIVCAPLIGPIDLAPYLGPEIEQVSVGGESVPKRVFAIMPGCSPCGISVRNTMFPFAFTRPGRVCSRTDVCTGFGGSFSIRRLGKPGSILR